MDGPVLIDQAAREIISQELRKNLLVEAGAGSGKTEEMTKRIHALISSGYRKIGEIVAITFTRKAAIELRERVRKTLEKELAASGEELLKEALEHIHECYIGTIHSFCAKMLRERPIEAGVDPGFVEIDDAGDELLRRRTWETYVMEADEGDKQILSLMDDFGVKEVAAKNTLKIVCDNQDVSFEAQDSEETARLRAMTAPQVVFERARETLRKLYELVRDHYSEIPDAVILGDAPYDSLQRSMMVFRQKTLGTKSEQLTNKALIELLMIFSTKTSVKITQRKWGDDKRTKDNAKQLGVDFEAFRDDFITPVIDLINASAYEHLLIPFAMKAKGIYSRHKQAVTELNFQDLLMNASCLLRDHPEVRIYFQSKYKTILIDEFQDTDPIQAEVAMFLTGKETEEKNWRLITPLEGSLFVVGDPKQSIYGFRRADFRLYRRFKEHFESTGGTVVELKTNFRATDDLGRWNNAVFPGLLKGGEQASFTRMDTTLHTVSGTLSGVSYYRIDEVTIPAIMASEPDALVRIINLLVGHEEISRRAVSADGSFTMVKQPVTYKDIMVLAGKKWQLERIANSVASFGIPVRIAGADITKRTGEFITFSELIRMLAYPEENAYVYSVMRGDFFGFSDRDIYRFIRRGGNFGIFFDFDAFYEENLLAKGIREVFDRVRECFAKLRRFTDYIQNLSPAAATERIIDELGIMRVHLTSSEKIVGLGSFVSLIERIRLRRVSDVWGLNLFIEELSSMIDNGFEEDIDIEGPEVNAVRFMNVHKAKGLEAPIVILCAPCSGRIPNSSFYTEQRLDDDGVERTYGYARIDKDPGGRWPKAYYAPLKWRDIDSYAQQAQELERDRLLYVAATRARNMLIVSDSASPDSPWSKLLESRTGGMVDILERAYLYEARSDIAELKPAPGYGADFDAELAEVNSRREAAFAGNRPTYIVRAPSRDSGPLSATGEGSEPGADEPERSLALNTMEIIISGEEKSVRDGRLTIGDIVHKVLDALVADESRLQDVFDFILEDCDDDYVTEDFLKGVAAEFRKKPLWDRIKKSDMVYTEVPFSYKSPASGSHVITAIDMDTYVNGVIDLVFKEADGWVIIDYKTYDANKVSSDLREAYEQQLSTYAEVWESITGEPVIEKEIFFVRKRVIPASAS